MFRLRDIQRRFDRAAASFDDADFVHAVTREGLLARLEPLILEARNILDLGSATGSTGRLLRKRFRRAHIVSLDTSHRMAARALAGKGWLARGSAVQADAGRLPFAEGVFDLVIANQLLPWLPNPGAAFSEVARVLRPGGVFAFATLGPDSLQELRRAWVNIDDDAHVHSFADMHDIGDNIVRAGLADPVLDVDRLTVSYEDADQLFSDLARAGARNTLPDRPRGLTSRRRFAAMRRALVEASSGGRIVLDLELVYGHCWGAGPRKDPANYGIPAHGIPRRNSRG
jgi:malonyl-CoA O-methyltransferase